MEQGAIQSILREVNSGWFNINNIKYFELKVQLWLSACEGREPYKKQSPGGRWLSGLFVWGKWMLVGG